MKTINSTFNEKQRFNQWYIWLVLFSLLIFRFIKLLSSKKNELEVNDILTSFLQSNKLIIAIILIIFIVRLKTSINHKGIKVSFSSILNLNWAWSEIEKFEIISYSFVGFGIRLSTKYGTVYNVRGNKGLQIHLKNGKKILIGTQKAQALEKFLLINNKGEE